MSVREVGGADVLDVEGTLNRFGGDKELFLEMTAMLLEDAPRLASELWAAVRIGDTRTAEMKAHALKGLVVGCGGARAAQAAQKLEDSAHRGDLTDSGPTMESAQAEVQALLDAIQAYHRVHASL